MGQAVDLPDPSEVPAAHISSADDLLSQMAGDEIDRLLAEAEVEKGSAEPEPITPEQAAALNDPAQSIDDADVAASTKIDDLFEDLAKQTEPSPEPAAQVPAPATAVPPVEQAISNDAAAIQAALLRDDAPAPAKPVIKATSTMPGAVLIPEAPDPEETPIPDFKAEARQLDEALASGSTDALPEVKAIEAETSTAEKSALTEAIEAIDITAAEPALERTPEPLPFYLKPLVWINFPMEFLPPPTREAIGKVALVTLANSIAILAYVLLFRRHH